MARTQREAMAEIQLRQLFLEWLDYDGRPLTDYDRNVPRVQRDCVAETYIRRVGIASPSYLPAAFVNPPEPMPAHVGLQIRAFKGPIARDRNSDPEWMCETAKAIGAYLNLPVIAYGHPGGCIIPSDMHTTWREAEGGRGHLARELGYLKSCRIMLGPDSGWSDLMAWLGVPVLLEKLPNPIVFESLRDSFQPRIALADRTAPLGPQIDALLCVSSLPSGSRSAQIRDLEGTVSLGLLRCRSSPMDLCLPIGFCLGSLARAPFQFRPRQGPDAHLVPRQCA